MRKFLAIAALLFLAGADYPVVAYLSQVRVGGTSKPGTTTIDFHSGFSSSGPTRGVLTVNNQSASTLCYVAANSDWEPCTASSDAGSSIIASARFTSNNVAANIGNQQQLLGRSIGSDYIGSVLGLASGTAPSGATWARIDFLGLQSVQGGGTVDIAWLAPKVNLYDATAASFVTGPSLSDGRWPVVAGHRYLLYQDAFNFGYLTIPSVQSNWSWSIQAANDSSLAPTVSADNFTIGYYFRTSVAEVSRGATLWIPSGFGNGDVLKCSLWQCSDDTCAAGTLLASGAVTLPTPAVAGLYPCYFSTWTTHGGQAPTPNTGTSGPDMPAYHNFAIGYYNTSSAHGTTNVKTWGLWTPGTLMPTGTNWLINSYCAISGDHFPSSGGCAGFTYAAHIDLIAYAAGEHTPWIPDGGGAPPTAEPSNSTVAQYQVIYYSQ